MRNATGVQKIISHPYNFYIPSLKREAPHNAATYFVDEIVATVVSAQHINIRHYLIATAGHATEIGGIGPLPCRKRCCRHHRHLFADVCRGKCPGSKSHIRDIERCALGGLFPVSAQCIGVVKVVADTGGIFSTQYVIIGATDKIVRLGIILVVVIREEQRSFAG